MGNTGWSVVVPVVVAIAGGVAAPAAVAAPKAAKAQIVVERVAAAGGTDGIDMNMVGVRLRCVTHRGVVCDLKVRVHRAAPKAATERRVLLPAGGARVVYVGLAGAFPKGLVGGLRAKLTVSGAAAGRTLAPVTKTLEGLDRGAQGRPFIPYPGPFVAMAAGASSRTVRFAYLDSMGGCGAVYRPWIVSQGAAGVVVEAHKGPSDAPAGVVCVATFTSECAKATLRAPLGRRTVWVRQDKGVLVAPADQATAGASVRGVPVRC